MDAFEELVAEIFRAKGYWVQQNVKIDLTPTEKRDLKNPSMPRPEIDLVAYMAGTNELIAVECKSYLDSQGVHVRDLKPGGRYERRYKMFTDGDLRKVVLKNLVEQFAARRMLQGNPEVRLALVYGKGVPSAERELQEWFDDKGWQLYGPEWLYGCLVTMASQPYDNQMASIVAKLLLKTRHAPAPVLA